MKNSYQIQIYLQYWKDLLLRPGVIQKIKRSRFKKPMYIQRKVIPKILQKKNLIVISPTASGKTLSYLLPLYQFVQYEQKKALILVPTKELTFQIRQMIQQIDKEFAYRCFAISGGLPLFKSKQDLQKPWSVLIATPGRLTEIVKEMPFLLNDIHLCIYDEFDKLLQVDFEDQIKFLDKKLHPKLQRLYFSATHSVSKHSVLPKYYDKIEIKQHRDQIQEKLYLMMNVKKKMVICLELLKQFFMPTEWKEKNVQKKIQALIFVNNRKKAEHLYGLLKQHYTDCEFLHGQSHNREKKFQDIMFGNIPLVITTDLMGRGVDTLQVDLVINFDLPRNYQDYVHHKGRVGRLGQKAAYYSFADTTQYIEFCKIEKETKHPIPLDPSYGNKEKWMLTAKAKYRNAISKAKHMKEIQLSQ